MEKCAAKSDKNVGALKRSPTVAAGLLAAAMLVCFGCGGADQAAKTSENDSSGVAGNTNSIPAGENSLNADITEDPVTAAKNARMQELRNANTQAATTSPKESTPLPAPENSEYSVSLGKVGLETRVFKDHKVINKVEKIIDGKRTADKIYLRSGKVVDVPAEKVENLRIISAAELMDLAGVHPAPDISDAPRFKATETKKPGN